MSYFSAIESPTTTIRASPSLYEGAFRLETSAGSPGSLFHPSIMFGRDERRKEEDIADQDDSPMSSPLDESYKIRIPRGSLSPRSHEEEDCAHAHSKNEDSEGVQDLSLTNQMDYQMDCKMEEEESAEEERSEEAD